MASFPYHTVKNQSFIPPRELHGDEGTNSNNSEAEFSFVGVFDDHDDGAMRIAHMQQLTLQSQLNAVTGAKGTSGAIIPHSQHAQPSRHNPLTQSIYPPMDKTPLPRQHARL